MRIVLLSIVLAACTKDTPTGTDARVITVIDAPSVDAAVQPDAPPDATVLPACMHVCDALATCFGGPGNSQCYAGCTTDLGDCSAEQIATIDACSTQACGDPMNDMSPLIDCLRAVTCIEMAVSWPSR